MSASEPVPIGPFLTNFPSDTSTTAPVTVSGAPCSSSVFPPSSRVTSLPTPAFDIFTTASGSAITAKTPPSNPASSTALRTTVPSQGAPPPGLSPMSARTIGHSSAAATLLRASLTGVGLTRKSLRRPHARSLSSSAHLSASSWSSLEVTMMLRPTSSKSDQGKPAATVMVSTPWISSILCAVSISLFIGCRPVNWAWSAGIMGGCLKAFVGLRLPSRSLAMMSIASRPLS